MTTHPCPRCGRELVLLQSKSSPDMVLVDFDSVDGQVWFFEPKLKGHREHLCELSSREHDTV